jgi:hypothetical protein
MAAKSLLIDWFLSPEEKLRSAASPFLSLIGTFLVPIRKSVAEKDRRSN